MSPIKRSGRPPAPLAVSPGFRALVLDHLDALGGVTARPMFGAVGLYCDDVFFGILARDTLYLKVDAGNRREYEQRGMHAFQPFTSRPTSMRYYAVPADIVESPLDLVGWARRALRAADR